MNLITWGSVNESTRRPTYTLSYATSSQVIVCDLAYDIAAMIYKLNPYPCSMPSTGLVREYLCSTMSEDEEYLFAGTTTGELVVFNADSHVFKTTVPVSSNGVHSIVTCQRTGHIYAGSGDGTIKKFVAERLEWSLVAHVQVTGRVVSLSISNDGTELLVGSSMGKCYRILTNDFSMFEVCTSHIKGINACGFGKQKSDIFATIGNDCTLRVWDLSDYSEISIVHESVPGHCLTFDEELETGLLISGWENGYLRAYEMLTGVRCRVFYRA